MTLEGDQISGKGVMVGGYVNPSRLHMQKYLHFRDSVSNMAKLWREHDDLEIQVATISSGMCICPFSNRYFGRVFFKSLKFLFCFAMNMPLECQHAHLQRSLNWKVRFR